MGSVCSGIVQLLAFYWAKSRFLGTFESFFLEVGHPRLVQGAYVLILHTFRRLHKIVNKQTTAFAIRAPISMESVECVLL